MRMSSSQKLLIVIFVLLLGVQATFTQASTNALGSISETVLPNGLKVIVKKREGGATVAGGLFIRGGVGNSEGTKSGIENLTLMLATEATKKYPRSVLRRELSKFGSFLDGSAGLDYSAISFASTKEGFETTWSIFADSVMAPSLTQGDLEIVKEKLIVGLRQRGVGPDSYLDVMQERYVYAGHPYRQFPAGTVESVKGIEIADVIKKQAELFKGARLVLIVVGDVEPQAIFEKARTAFGTLPKGVDDRKAAQAVTFSKPSVEIEPKDTETTYVRGVFAAAPLGSADYHAMEVAVAILQSRVYQEVRVKRNLSYAPNAEMEDNAANTANIYVTSTSPSEAVAVMLREIETLKTEEVGGDEFSGIPSYFLTTYFVKLETNAAQVGELARYDLFGGGWRKSGEFIQKINSVTPSEVKRVASTYMRNIKFLVIGKSSGIDKPLLLNTK